MGVYTGNVLKMATINAAFVIGEQDGRGAIHEGFVADFILSEKNPLEDIHNLKPMKDVMLRGKWLQIDELNSYLEVM